MSRNRGALAGGVLALALALGLLAWFAAARLDPRAEAQEPPPENGLKTAIFAGGCFWCMVHPYDQLRGVTKVVSGYSGGTTKNPTYKQVTDGKTGHAEAVQVTYDPDRISYQKLLDVFWINIDPLDAGGQFCDRGSSYRSAIFVADREQRKIAEQSKATIEKQLTKKVVTEIAEAGPFWRAEDKHQDYYKTNSIAYRFYRAGCGRDTRLETLWGTVYRGRD